MRYHPFFVKLCMDKTRAAIPTIAPQSVYFGDVAAKKAKAATIRYPTPITLFAILSSL